MPAPTQTLYFSHSSYDKLKNIDTKNPIILLETFVKKNSDLGIDFIEYDTTYHNDKGDKFNFNLSESTKIVLLFIDSNQRLFTTIRPYAAKKLSYYSAMRGREFIIEFKEYDQPNGNVIERHIPKINRSFVLS